MTDLSATIAAKSDQLNADDLFQGARTIVVRDVTAGSSKEQPISIFYDGDDNKPYKPCLTMRRALVQLWGPDGKTYKGKAMTVYRDPNVLFGKDKVGGIRISHVSDIDSEVTLALTVTRGSKRGFKFLPLRRSAPAIDTTAKERQTPQQYVDERKAMLTTAADLERVEGIAKSSAKAMERMRADGLSDMADDLQYAIDARRAELGGGE